MGNIDKTEKFVIVANRFIKGLFSYDLYHRFLRFTSLTRTGIFQSKQGNLEYEIKINMDYFAKINYRFKK